MSLENLLKNTLKALYYDSPEITSALNEIDFSKVNRKFREELFSRISEEEFYKMDAILHSDEYMRYKDAIDRSSMAITNELANIIEFTMTQNEGGKLN